MPTYPRPTTPMVAVLVFSRSMRIAAGEPLMGLAAFAAVCGVDLVLEGAAVEGMVRLRIGRRFFGGKEAHLRELARQDDASQISARIGRDFLRIAPPRLHQPSNPSGSSSIFTTVLKNRAPSAPSTT